MEDYGPRLEDLLTGRHNCCFLVGDSPVVSVGLAGVEEWDADSSEGAICEAKTCKASANRFRVAGKRYLVPGKSSQPCQDD